MFREPFQFFFFPFFFSEHILSEHFGKNAGMEGGIEWWCCNCSRHATHMCGYTCRCDSCGDGCTSWNLSCSALACIEIIKDESELCVECAGWRDLVCGEIARIPTDVRQLLFETRMQDHPTDEDSDTFDPALHLRLKNIVRNRALEREESETVSPVTSTPNQPSSSPSLSPF